MKTNDIKLKLVALNDFYIFRNVILITFYLRSLLTDFVDYVLKT